MEPKHLPPKQLGAPRTPVWEAAGNLGNLLRALAGSAGKRATATAAFRHLPLHRDPLKILEPEMGHVPYHVTRQS